MKLGKGAPRVRILDLNDLRTLWISAPSHPRPPCLQPQPLGKTKWHVFKSYFIFLFPTHLPEQCHWQQFLNLSTIDIWGQINFAGGGDCPVQRGMFSTVIGVYPLDASSPLLPVETIKNASAYCQMSRWWGGGENHPSLRATGLEKSPERSN